MSTVFPACFSKSITFAIGRYNHLLFQTQAPHSPLPTPQYPLTPSAHRAPSVSLASPPSAPPNVRGTSAVPLHHSRTLHALRPPPSIRNAVFVCRIAPAQGASALQHTNTATHHTRYAQHATGLSRRLLKKANRRASPSAQDPRAVRRGAP